MLGEKDDMKRIDNSEVFSPIQFHVPRTNTLCCYSPGQSITRF